MPRSDAERRAWRLSLVALVVLVPATMAAVGWRDVKEVRRTMELDAIAVPAGGTAGYNGAQVTLAGFDALPPTPGLPPDRTFVRTRLAIAPTRPGGEHWLACRERLVGADGRAWSAIESPPSLIERSFEKPGESRGSYCTALALGAAPAGGPVLVQSYYFVPRAALPGIAVTLSAMGARPAYLRFAR